MGLGTLWNGFRYTVEGFQYIKAEDQNLPIGTPNIYNKIGLQDG